MFKCKFKTNTTAFSDGYGGSYEAARILHNLACKIDAERIGSGPVRDRNGNRVGFWSLEGGK